MARNTQVHWYLSQPALLSAILAAHAVKLCEVCFTPLVLAGGAWGKRAPPADPIIIPC